MFPYGLVSLQRDYWDNPWQNRHAMMSAFAQAGAPVLFLGPPFELGDVLEGGASRRTQTHGLQRVADRLHAYTPPRTLPRSGRFPAVDKVSVRGLRTRIRRELDRLEIDRPVAYVWHPAVVPSLELFEPAAVIYHKYDHYQGYAGGSDGPDTVENALIARADAVLVTSQGLAELHAAQRPDIACVPNGVDYERFADAAERRALPADLARIPSPRIGYVGVVNEKVDFDLLDALAGRHPEWSLVLVGPDRVRDAQFRERLNTLARRPNCHLLGERTAADVPHYVAGMAVCLMSYLVNGWTFYGYPLKMHEYLATGRPSVATDLPAIREFRDVVTIAHGVDEWEAAIEAALRDDDASAVARRQAVARANSWAERTRVVDAIIRACLARRAPGPSSQRESA